MSPCEGYGKETELRSFAMRAKVHPAAQPSQYDVVLAQLRVAVCRSTRYTSLC